MLLELWNMYKYASPSLRGSGLKWVVYMPGLLGQKRLPLYEGVD